MQPKIWNAVHKIAKIRWPIWLASIVLIFLGYAFWGIALVPVWMGLTIFDFLAIYKLTGNFRQLIPSAVIFIVIVLLMFL